MKMSVGVIVTAQNKVATAMGETGPAAREGRPSTTRVKLPAKGLGRTPSAMDKCYSHLGVKLRDHTSLLGHPKDYYWRDTQRRTYIAVAPLPPIPQCKLDAGTRTPICRSIFQAHSFLCCIGLGCPTSDTASWQRLTPWCNRSTCQSQT
jgi:hypothetical protein